MNLRSEKYVYLCLKPVGVNSLQRPCLILLLIIGIQVPVSKALEEPGYVGRETAGEYEIRAYDPYLVAEVIIDGSFDETGSKAFRMLAGYIFGDNQQSEKMAMTAPVTRQRTGVKMNMTAPVTRESVGAVSGERYAYHFVMEQQYTLETLPVPTNPAVKIIEVPGKTLAVRRYAGRSNEKNFLKHLTALQSALENDGLEYCGAPVSAVYNSPFVPGPFRRNEVMLSLGSDCDR